MSIISREKVLEKQIAAYDKLESIYRQTLKKKDLEIETLNKKNLELRKRLSIIKEQCLES